MSDGAAENLLTIVNKKPDTNRTPIPDSCFDCHKSPRFLMRCVQNGEDFFCCDQCFRRRKSNGMGWIECREIWRV